MQFLMYPVVNYQTTSQSTKGEFEDFFAQALR